MIRTLCIAVCILAPSVAPAAVRPSLPSPNWPAPADRGDVLLRATALTLHNRARADFGTAPLSWSAALEVEAQAYADQMARTGIYGHDVSPRRKKSMGENLWRGPRGVFSYEVMVGLMVDEVEHFRPGIFPTVSATGEWSHVAHYTQIVWPTTTAVGCAVASSHDLDYLVCRYSPKGNRDGVALGVPGPARLALAESRD